MSDNSAKIESDRQRLIEAQQKGGLTKLKAYLQLSGPGWLQSALTLGGGSLASSLYLGVVAGVTLLWLQPLAMILGIIMLSAIGYVCLSTGDRPFRAIIRHINPVLGWAWLLATMAANMVWALPQYSLFYGVTEQNLLPGLFGEGGPLAGDGGKWAVSAIVLVISTIVVWGYGSGGWGVKIYEGLLKIVVALIVACFFAVVLKMSLSSDGISWGEVLAGFVPNLRQLSEPAAGLRTMIEAIENAEAQSYWTSLVVNQQREVMISAAATAVGINMTFLLPYSMMAKDWTREFRGLASFDLSTGMFIPYVLATTCVTIAAANQFHARLPEAVQVVDGNVVVPEPANAKFQAALDARRGSVAGPVSLAEQQLAAAQLKKDAGALANSLERLFDDRMTAHYIFGFGVAAMALSSISLLMLISGFVVCEILDVPPTGWTHRIGCLAAASGAFWPILWSGKARFWLAIVTSNFGMVLLPIAYLTFFLMMNSKSLLKDDLPTGGKRIAMNVAMAMATGAAMLASGWVVWNKTQWYGVGGVAALVVLTVVVHFKRDPNGYMFEIVDADRP